MAIPATRRAGLVAVLAGLVLTVAACGSSQEGDATPEPAPTIPMMPSANPFTSALVFTNGLGTAKLAVTATTSVGDETVERSGTVTAAFDPRGYGIGAWTSNGSAVDEIANDKAVFERPAGSDGLWTQQPEGERTLTSRLIAPLTGLGDLTGAVNEGPDDVDGTAATRWTGQLAADPDRLRALGLTDEDLATIGDAWEGASIDVVVWIDGRDRIVRVDRAFDIVGENGVPVSAKVSARLTDFTAPLDLTGPPSASVTALPGSPSSSRS